MLFEEILPNNKGWLSPEKINSQIEWLRFLPLIAYVNKYPNAGARDMIRVKQFFKNLVQLDDVSKDVSGLLSEAIEIIRKMKSSDIAEIIYLESISKQLLTDEEKLKFSIFLEAENREEIEEIFWSITDEKIKGQIWKGEIMPLLKWSSVDEKFNFEEFKKFQDVFYRLFSGNCDSKKIDLTRRALITFELNGYPRHFRGSTNKSFGKECNDWKILINDNREKFEQFLRTLIASEDVDKSQEEMCKDFPIEKEWSEFVHISELMTYCDEKNIQWWNNDRGWVLIKGKNARKEHANVDAYKLYLEYIKNTPSFWNSSIWEIWFYERGDTCVVFDNKSLNIAIDIKCLGAKGFNVIEMFKRDTKPEIIEEELFRYGQKFGFKFNQERYVSSYLNKVEAKELIQKIMSEISI